MRGVARLFFLMFFYQFRSFQDRSQKLIWRKKKTAKYVPDEKNMACYVGTQRESSPPKKWPIICYDFGLNELRHSENKKAPSLGNKKAPSLRNKKALSFRKQKSPVTRKQKSFVTQKQKSSVTQKQESPVTPKQKSFVIQKTKKPCHSETKKPKKGIPSIVACVCVHHFFSGAPKQKDVCKQILESVDTNTYHYSGQEIGPLPIINSPI